MTEPITPAAMPTRIDPPAEDTTTGDERPPMTTDQLHEEIRKLRKENASWRTKLREAESSLEKASEHLDTMRHTEVERLAAEALRDPKDLWQHQPAIEAFLGETGAIDGAKVEAAAAELVAEKPHYAADKRVPPPPSNRPIESLRGGASPGNLQPPQKPSWSDVIPKPAGRMGPTGEG